jgi:hypothetical protein
MSRDMKAMVARRQAERAVAEVSVYILITLTAHRVKRVITLAAARACKCAGSL